MAQNSKLLVQQFISCFGNFISRNALGMNWEMRVQGICTECVCVYNVIRVAFTLNVYDSNTSDIKNSTHIYLEENVEENGSLIMVECDIYVKIS